MMTFPPPMGVMKLSCFSAVKPVMGWNQWVKWVAPCSSAQIFMPSAMALATSRLRDLPSFRQACHAATALWETYLRMASSLKTQLPNSSGIRSFSMGTSCVNSKYYIVSDCQKTFLTPLVIRRCRRSWTGRGRRGR